MELRRRDQASDLLSPVASGGETGRAIVIEPWVKVSPRRNVGAQAGARTPEARLEEAVGLARAIDLTIVQAGLVTLNDIRPATYIGKGKVDEIAGMVKRLSASIVVMDCPISPVQQRNLEKAWNAKVIDRTGLILEIFGRRARTREGTLQVELAHLTYQKSRLVRSWTHLERQRGLSRDHRRRCRGCLGESSLSWNGHPGPEPPAAEDPGLLPGQAGPHAVSRYSLYL